MATSGNTICGICEIRQKTCSACVWCPECEDALCPECQEHHGISKGTRNHTTIPIEDYQKLPHFILDIKLFCEEYNEKYQNYCLNHELPLCKKCIVTTHKKCEDTTILDDVTHNTKSSVAMEAVEQSMNDILCKMNQIKQYQERNLEQVNYQKNNIIKEISNVRDQVNKHLDRMEKNILAELSSVVEVNKKRLADLLQCLTSKEKKMKEIQSSIGKIKQYASDFQTFLGMKEID